MELDSSLNYKVNLTMKDYSKGFSKNELDKITFLHYAGSFKPWTVRERTIKNLSFTMIIFLKKYLINIIILKILGEKLHF